MAKPVGVDLGSRTIKILTLETSGKRYRISRFFNEPLPSLPEEGSASRVIATLFKDNKLPRDQVVLGFDAYASIIRELTVPFKNPDQIRKIIKYESEGQLFSFGIDEVVIDFVKVRENPESSDLIVIAVVKEILGEKIRTLEEAYIDPLSADIDLLAHYNSLSITPYMEEHGTLALIDVGFQSTKMLVVSEGLPVLLRGMRGGLSSIVNAIQQETGTTLPAADEKVRSRLPAIAPSLAEEDPKEEVMVVVQDGEELPESSDMERGRDELEDEFLADRTTHLCGKIVRELNRSLARLQTSRPVDLILLTGGGSQIPGLADSIHRGLGIPVRMFDVLEHVDHSFSDEERAAVEPFVSVPLGLALKQLGGDASGTEFRREELAFQKRFEQIKIPLTVCLVLLLGFLGLVTWRFRSDYKLRGQEYDLLTWQVVNAMGNTLGMKEFQRYLDKSKLDENGNAYVVLDKIPGSRFQRHLKVHKQIREVRRALDREMGKVSDSDTDKHNCALKTWNELFKYIAMAQNEMNNGGLSPIIPYIEFNQKGVKCNLVLRSYRERDPLVKAIDSSDLLKVGKYSSQDHPDDLEDQEAVIYYLQDIPLKVSNK